MEIVGAKIDLFRKFYLFEDGIDESVLLNINKNWLANLF